MEKKKLKIEFYDEDGKICDKAEGEYDGRSLLDLLGSYANGEFIPVVRQENEPANDAKLEWAPGLSFRVKIGNLEFDVSGQPDESKKMYERIQEDLPRLIKTANSDVEEIQTAMNEFRSLMNALK